MHTSHSRRVGALALSTAALAGVFAGTHTGVAHAAITNPGTVSGDTSHGAVINWHASSMVSDKMSTYPHDLAYDEFGGAFSDDPFDVNIGQVSNVVDSHNNTMQVDRFVTRDSGGTFTINEHVVVAAGNNTALTGVKVHVDPAANMSSGAASPLADAGAAGWQQEVAADPTLSDYRYAQASTVGGFPAAGTVNAAGDYTINRLDKMQAVVLNVTYRAVSQTDLDKGVTFTASAASTDQMNGSMDPALFSFAPPATTHVQVDGVNNDKVSDNLSPYGGMVSKVSDTGWVNGTDTRVYAMQAGHWFKLPNGSLVHSVKLVDTDKGVWPRKVTSTNSNEVVGVFAVKSYKPTTAGMVHTVAANNARHVLAYLFDTNNAPALSKAYRKGTYVSLANHFTVEYVSPTVGQVAQYKSLGAAINADTKKTPNLGGVIRVGSVFTDAEMLPKGASVRYPWTAKPTVPSITATEQHQWSTVKVPALRTVTVGVQPAVSSTQVTDGGVPLR